MNKSALVFIAGFIGLMCILVSCLEELEHVDKIGDSTFEPAVEFPLVNSNFSMEEFLTDGESQGRVIEQGGVMVLVYDDSKSTPSGESLFLLPDQQSPTLSITGPDVAFPMSGATVTVTKDVTFAFNSSQGEALDSILAKAGQLLFQISSSFPANIDLTINIPTIKQQGIPFQQNFDFIGPGNQNPTIDLAGAVFDLTNNGTATNTISVSITALITDTGQPINNTHRLDFSFGIDNLNFRGLFGDIGTHSVPLSADSIDIDVFNNTFGGNVTFLSPLLHLSMENSFGLPLDFGIQNIFVVKPGMPTVTLSGPAVNAPLNPYLLSSPGFSQIGQSVSSGIDINSGNSNLSNLISIIPQYLFYRFNLTLNPNGVTDNFILDTSRLTIGIHLELPFHGQADRLRLSKRYDFNGLGIDDVGVTKIKLKTINELPLQMNVQIYFRDGNGAILDSLFTDRKILEGAPVDANGFTQSASEVIMEVPITNAKIDRIDQAERLEIVAEASTTNNGTVPVKFSATDKLQISLGVHTKVKYNLK